MLHHTELLFENDWTATIEIVSSITSGRIDREEKLILSLV